MEKLVIIVLIILIIIMLTRFRIVIKKDFNKGLLINLYIFPKLSIKLNVEKYFKKYKDGSFKNIIGFLLEDISLLNDSRSIIKSLLKISRVRKVEVLVNYSVSYISNIYLYCALWTLLSYTKNLFDKHARRIDNEYYNINICQECSGLYIYLDMIFPFALLLFIGLKNIKIIIKGILKHGSSNKRTSKAIS